MSIPPHDPNGGGIERVEGEIDEGPRSSDDQTAEAVEASEAVLFEYRRNAPLPPPAEFAGYDSVLPGAAERILRMAETASQFEIERSRSAWKTANKIVDRITLLVIVGFALAGYMVYSGHDITGAITALATFGASLFSIFRRKKQTPQEPSETEEDASK